MKGTLLYIIFLFFVCTQAQAQNLITNPSFESYVACPTGITPPNFSTGIAYNPAYTSFLTVNDWITPLKATTPDYFNTCAPANVPGSVHVPDNFEGYQQPHTGNAYAGIHSVTGVLPDFHSEYIETKLSQPMQAGHQYYVSFYVNFSGMNGGANPSPFTNYAVMDKIGAIFSNSVVYSSTNAVISAVPAISNPTGNFISDTVNWVKVQGVYSATGGETWMVIGAFSDSTPVNYQLWGYSATTFVPDYSEDTYLYIDDVCVTDMANVITSSEDTTVCPQSFPLTISAPDTGKYIWSTSDTTASIAVTDTGTYYVQVFGECAYYADTIHVKRISPPKLSIGNDTSICDTQQLQLSSNNVYQSYQWSTGDTTASIIARDSGQYTLVVDDGCEMQRDSVRVTYLFPPVAPAVNDTIICQDVQAPTLTVAGDSLIWYANLSDTGTLKQPFINTDSVGMYTLYVARYNTCGLGEKSPIHIKIMGAPTGISQKDTTLCSGSPVMLGVTIDNVSYLWSTGDTASNIVVETTGAYYLTASNNCGSITDTVNVTFDNCDSCLLIPNAFTPNGDGLNDFFNIIPRCKIGNYHIKIANRWGQIVFESYNIGQGWDGNFNGIPADVGTYYYVLQAYPELVGGRMINAKGDITLIR